MTDVGLNSFEKMQVDADLFRLSKKKKEKDAGFPIRSPIKGVPD